MEWLVNAVQLQQISPPGACFLRCVMTLGLWGFFRGPLAPILAWPTDLPSSHISSKEIFPVMAATIVWGHRWQGLSDRFHSEWWLFSTQVQQETPPQTRCLSLLAAKHNFIVSADHILGAQNVLADALSKNNYTFPYR